MVRNRGLGKGRPNCGGKGYIYEIFKNLFRKLLYILYVHTMSVYIQWDMQSVNVDSSK